MADFRDWVAARGDTDAELASLDSYAGSITNGREGDVCIMLALGFRAVVAAIREVGTAADYVARDLR